jgi:hypothetical protein
MDQRERTAVAAAAAAAAVYGFGFGPDHSTQPLHQAGTLRPYNQALKHRLEDASWVCCSHYGLRLIVVRTATLSMRRLLVWCERLSCSSELVVVMSIVRGRGAVESCGRKPGNRPRGTRSLVRIRARDEAARREAGRRGRALNGRRDAPGLWSLMMMIGTSSNDE